MRISHLSALAPLALASLASALDAAHWAKVADSSKDGIIILNSESYDQIVTQDRDYSVLVTLTALPANFKCQPCHDFDPSLHSVASSWKRQPSHIRNTHFYAQLDFTDGQAIYQRLGLANAPTVQFHPALSGPNKSNKLGVIQHDLNRVGLSAPALHSFIQPLTASFPLHKPFNPLPMIFTTFSISLGALVIYTAWPALVPIIQSRIVWGVASIIMILTFNSGFMWNKIKGTPYVAAGEGGKLVWIAGGFQNQLGLESQVVGGIYGVCALCIIVLSLLVPAQTSPMKQRIGVYVWLGLLVVVFSLLFRLFAMKNGGYPFRLLF